MDRKKNTCFRSYLRGGSAFSLIFFSFLTTSYSATYYSKANGNWNSSSTWTTSCGSVAAGSVPTASDNAVLCSGYTVTLNADKSCTAITINSGGVLVVAGSYTLTVSGATSVSGIFNMSSGAFKATNSFTVASGGVYDFSGGTFTSSNSFTVDGTVNMSAGTLNLTGATGTNDLNVNGVFNQSGGTIDIAHFAYFQNSGTFNLSGTGSFTTQNQLKFRNTKGVFNISGGTAYMKAGINSTTTLDQINQTGGTIQLDNTANWTMNGTYNATAGTAIFNGVTTLDTVTLSASWTFFNLIINAGKTLNQNNARNINVKGNWTNNGGTYTHSGERVTFNGSASQSITGTAGTTFDSLTINNSSTTGVTLLKPVTVSTILTLTDGYVYTDAVNLMIISNNASSTSGSNVSFVSGPMKKVGNDPFVFPVGSAGIWARLEMVDDASFLYYNANTEFTCQYYDAGAPNNSAEYMAATIKHVSYEEYWDLERTYDTANNAQCNVRLYWEDATRSGINDNDHLLLAHFNSGAGYYQDQLGTATGGLSGYITSTVPLTSFSPFSFASDTAWASGVNPLPIGLLTFNAYANGSAVNLNWSTASETNNDFFSIEKTTDGINFEVVGTVKGAGNSSEILNYSFIDFHPSISISYYRLKQTDYDGHFSYSELAAVNIGKQSYLYVDVYPNPNDGKRLNLIVNAGESEEVMVLVQDMYGNTIYSELINALQNPESVYIADFSQKLIPGLYLITVSSGDNKVNNRLIVN